MLCLLACPPAEREIKYKSEKKQWEEQQKELATRLAALSREVEAYRGTSGAQQLEDRIQVGAVTAQHMFQHVCTMGNAGAEAELHGSRKNCRYLCALAQNPVPVLSGPHALLMRTVRELAGAGTTCKEQR